jgi:PAS domain S-box-containing protein
MKPPSAVSPYLIAVAATAAAAMLRWLLDPWMDNAYPFVTIFGAVAIAVWNGGYRPAILATVLGVVSCEYLFIEPRGSLAIHHAGDAIGFVLFLATCLTIIGFGEAMRVAQRHAERQLTERKRWEETSRRSEEQLRRQAEHLETLLEALPVGVFIAHDTDCRKITGNRAAYEFLRVSPAANLSLTAPPEERRPPFRVFRNGTQLEPTELPAQRAAKGERVWQEELDVVFDDGSSVKELINAVPLFDAHGQVRGAVGVVLDVTKERMALEALRASEERLRQALRAGRLACFVVDIATHAVTADADHRAMWGLDPDAALTRDSYFKVIHPDDLERVERNEQAALLAGHLEVEFRIVRPDGQVRWLAEHTDVVRGADGKAEQLIGLNVDITERKEAEQALRYSELRYRSLVSILADVPWLANPAGELVGPHPEHFKFTDSTEEQNRGEGWADNIHPHDRERVKELWRRAVETGTRYENRGRIWHAASQSYHHYVGRAIPVRNDDGSIREWVGAITDIHEQKLAEEALRQSEERHRRITDLIPFGAWATDTHGVPTYLSPLFLDMLGQTLEQHQRAWPDTIHPEDTPATVSKWHEFVTTGGEWNHEFRMRGKDGQYRTILACGIPVLDAAGRVTEFVGLNYDITARKQAEARIVALNAQLSADLQSMTRLQELSTRMVAAEDYRLLLEEILNAAIEITSADMGNIQLLEDDALKIVVQRGFDAPFLEFFAAVHDGHGSCCGAAKEKAARVIVEDVASSPIFSGTRNLEVMLAANARAVQSTPLVSRSGRLLGVFSTHFHAPHRPSERELRLLDLLARQAADLIETKQAEESLRVADRRKDDFLATLAHELRNPLAPLQNSLEVLRRAADNKLVIEQARSMMGRQVMQLVKLIDDLLDVSRITNGKLQLRKECVELRDVLDIAIESAQPLLEKSAHELVVALPREPVHVQADPTRLAQVFMNLLSNAVKYTDKAGHIWLTAERRGNEAAVAVRDTGIGIAGEHLVHVFEMFSQVTSALERSQGGLGIGLSLVKGLVELHGGRIDARSAGPGLGSEFTVHLPVVEIPIEAPQEPGGAEEASRVAKRRVLVVDDLRDSAESMAMMLQLMGHETRTAYDGLEAVQAAAAFQPNIALLDIGLPKMNGYDVARLIREQSWGGNVALVALTGWGQEEDKRRALEAGFDHHLTKPVGAATLEKLLTGLSPMLHP